MELAAIVAIVLLGKGLTLEQPSNELGIGAYPAAPGGWYWALNSKPPPCWL